MSDEGLGIATRDGLALRTPSKLECRALVALVVLGLVASFLIATDAPRGRWKPAG
jgi:hypothetical protein